uniref:Transcriptional regulator n=1 Tax=Heterorhabditis bacteriophora TaxID=37862 RepID=A0A1I7X409_HETBA
MATDMSTLVRTLDDVVTALNANLSAIRSVTSRTHKCPAASEISSTI